MQLWCRLPLKYEAVWSPLLTAMFVGESWHPGHKVTNEISTLWSFSCFQYWPDVHPQGNLIAYSRSPCIHLCSVALGVSVALSHLHYFFSLRKMWKDIKIQLFHTLVSGCSFNFIVDQLLCFKHHWIGTFCTMIRFTRWNCKTPLYQLWADLETSHTTDTNIHWVPESAKNHCLSITKSNLWVMILTFLLLLLKSEIKCLTSGS